jgi:hypothetical protein
MADLVYILCMVSSVACAALLLRSYFRAKSRLLLWSSICFAGLALNNILLLVDLWIGTRADLSNVRSLVALGALGFMLYGLVWDTK